MATFANARVSPGQYKIFLKAESTTGQSQTPQDECYSKIDLEEILFLDRNTSF